MKTIFLLLLLAVPLTASAEWGKFEYEFDEEKPWAEIEAQLPSYPKEESLLPFFVSAATDNRFFVDASSISTGGDGVVRYIANGRPIAVATVGRDTASLEAERSMEEAIESKS